MTGPSKKTERETFAAYCCDEATIDLLKAAAPSRGWSENMVFSGGIAGAVRALGAMPCPEFLIVDLSDSEDPRADVQALAEVCEEGTVVLTIGALNDVGLYRDLLHAGVHDYLVKPLAVDVIKAAMHSAEEAMNAVEEVEEEGPASEGKTIFFIGVRGGMGTSTLAANTAWLSANGGESTALLDLDFHFSSSAIQFDLEPGRGLLDALDNPNRVDGLFLDRAVVKPSEKLSILCTEAAIGVVPRPAEGALEHLVDTMANTYRNVVVDMPRHMVPEQPEVLNTATDIVLITDLSLSSARDCIRLKAYLKTCAPAASVHVVLNKLGAVPAEVEEKDFANSIETEINARVPFDAKAMLLAVQQGTVIADHTKSGKVTAGMKAVNSLFTSGSENADGQKPSWVNKLLQRKAS
ncbi:AAA family ATPase [Kordiimonas laminariae]|uniref:AAA family ATPase n=1 Tax=Kordiimonas laminariae TaxID=2917717 RepID=UPI001FF5153F|nr:hypothetical protein [Kordiimonas laminariae]MCK0068200.1 hypothetical protein [Kordiimonas laminariae]